jgi:hypothetical protein
MPAGLLYERDFITSPEDVLRDEIRGRWQHSVAPAKELRYSITFRTRR